MLGTASSLCCARRCSCSVQRLPSRSAAPSWVSRSVNSTAGWCTFSQAVHGELWKSTAKQHEYAACWETCLIAFYPILLSTLYKFGSFIHACSKVWAWPEQVSRPRVRLHTWCPADQANGLQRGGCLPACCLQGCQCCCSQQVLKALLPACLLLNSIAQAGSCCKPLRLWPSQACCLVASSQAMLAISPSVGLPACLGSRDMLLQVGHQLRTQCGCAKFCARALKLPCLQKVTVNPCLNLKACCSRPVSAHLYSQALLLTRIASLPAAQRHGGVAGGWQPPPQPAWPAPVLPSSCRSLLSAAWQQPSCGVPLATFKARGCRPLPKFCAERFGGHTACVRHVCPAGYQLLGT